MALITCTECGKTISDKAANCIGCGCPMSIIFAVLSGNAKKVEQSEIATLRKIKPQPKLTRYKKCPRCEINVLRAGEHICYVCANGSSVREGSAWGMDVCEEDRRIDFGYLEDGGDDEW